ncbi:MAG: DUF177 domain-containing protein [Patescibacteria group bacterium]
MLEIGISHFLGKQQGGTEEFTIDCDMDSHHVTGSAQLMRLPHEINVQIVDLHADYECICNRCLTHYSQPVDVPFAEREFIIDLTKREISEDEDVFYVNKDKNEISLDEMVNQELLLHFPATTVCSESCKGVCDKCGKNLNLKDCSCKHEHAAKITPFSFPRS